MSDALHLETSEPMRGGARIDPAPYLAMDLRVHEVLAGVPLHDVWQVRLPGGGPGRTIADLRELLDMQAIAETHAGVRFLFGLRSWLGRILGWDREPSPAVVPPKLDRLPAELRESSLRPPGTPDGPFRLLYELDREMVSEIRNATVHAFSVLAIEAVGDDYVATWAIYVAPVSRWTGAYMALIAPFRRFLVYPVVLRAVQRGWRSRHGGGAAAEVG